MKLLLLLKAFWPKALVWLKIYWYIPVLIIYTILVFCFARNKLSSALKLLANQKESYEKQIKVINESNAKNLAEKEKALKDYQKLMQNLEAKYDILEKDLDRKKKERIKELLKQDNKTFAQDLAKELNWIYSPDMEDLKK